MSQKNMVTSKFLTIILGTALIIAGLYIAFSPNPSKAMEKVALGSTYQNLLAIAGNPSYETDGTLWVEPQHKKANHQIIKSSKVV